MRKGFSFIELLIGIIILLLSLMTFFTVNQATSSKSMTSYYKFMANSIGSEVIDFCQGMGYHWAKQHLGSGASTPFPLSSWHRVSDHNIFSKNIRNEDINLDDSYFSESKYFERKIELQEITTPFNAIKVVVQLRMKRGSKAAKFLNNETLNFSSVILEQKP